MKICSLSIRYTIDCDGLNQEKEFDPYVSVHTSFGGQRVKENDLLIRIDRPKPLSIRRGYSAKDEGEEESSAKKIVMSHEEIPCYRSSKPLEIVLVDYDQMKGDDTIRFKLFSHTNYSGVDSIDKSEGPYRTRQIPSGFCDLELIDLFKYYHEAITSNNHPKEVTFDVKDLFIDQKVIDEKVHELLEKNRMPTEKETNDAMQQARGLTEKACITFTVTMRNFDEALFQKSIFAVDDLTVNHLHSMLPLDASLVNKRNKTKQQPHFHSVLFNSSKTWHLWLRAMNSALGQYCAHFMGDEETGELSLYKPCDASVSNLQLPIYASEVGKMPVYAYWSNHDPYYREYSSKEARDRDLQLYGFDAKTEEYFLLMLHSALRRFGLDEETMIREIELHFSPTNTSTCPAADFLRVEEAIADIGTAVANSADYTADYRFMTTENRLKDGHTTIGEQRRCTKCSRVLRDHEGELAMRVVQLDSWDNTILNNTSSCDDCEGQDNTATTVLRSYAIGRPDLGMDWASPALRAVKKLLAHSAIYDVGALVTSAFMDTNNKKIDVKQEELPLIGSEMDKKAQNDGHCFGLMQSLTRTIGLFAAGNVDREVIARMEAANKIGGTRLQEERFRERDSKRKLLVLEPTGSIEARLLPLAESYGDESCYDPEGLLFKKKKAEFLFMKALRAKLKEEAYKDSGIAELFVGEGMPHYVERQVAQRRTSSFYNSVVHGSSVDMMRFDPTLSQFAFCTNDKYGVRIGELIRDSPQSALSLVCPYAKYREKWEAEIVPMVESIQNQMPIMKFGRYTDKEYAEEIYSRFISPTELSASFAFTSPTAYTTKQNIEAQRKFEALLKETNPLSSNKTIVRLFSRVWKLNQSKEKTELMNRFIRELPGVIDHGYYVEKYVPVCEPVVEDLIVIDVDKVLALLQ